ncbi:MAG TPA: hypothetical protein VH619_02225 [Verrucomicrobiae bacterium]|nr:hypothetical protein [Verrucomicrobiae bacterium]
MKTLTKSILAGAAALALVTLGTSSAEARPWYLPPLPGRVAVGVTVAPVTPAPYYAYPAPVYPYPVARPVPYFYGGFRGGYGWGWGPHYGYGGRGFGGYRGGYHGGYRR